MKSRRGPPIYATARIEAPAAEVWAAVSTPGYLERCHPFCARNPVQRWPGVGSVDEIHYRSGWIYERRFVDWLDGIGYDLEIGGSGEPTSFVSWRIASVDEATSSLTITVRPHALGGVPAVIRWLPRFSFIRPMLRRYLKSVVRGVDWYVTQGESVRADQFGRHPWFSERRRRLART